MTDSIYKKIELTGSSTVGMQQAIENAISKASKTIHDMRWFEVIETRGHIENGGFNLSLKGTLASHH